METGSSFGCNYFLAFFFLMLTSCCVVSGGCSYHTPARNLSRASWCSYAGSPRVIGVLPFQNSTSDQDISQLVRASFYSHLTIRPYKDVELNQIDQALQDLGIKTISSSNKKAIMRLGRKLGLDYLVFGRVRSKERLYVAVYSRASLYVEILVVEARSGKAVWKDSYIATSHGGGIPLSPLAIPLISIFSGLNLRNSVMLNMVEEACRNLAYRMPLFAPNKEKPNCCLSGIPHYVLQVGAFSQRLRAVSQVEFLRNKGYPAYLKEKLLRSKKFYRVLLGPYESMSEAQRVKKKIEAETGIKPVLKRLAQKAQQ